MCLNIEALRVLGYSNRQKYWSTEKFNTARLHLKISTLRRSSNVSQIRANRLIVQQSRPERSISRTKFRVKKFYFQFFVHFLA